MRRTFCVNAINVGKEKCFIGKEKLKSLTLGRLKHSKKYTMNIWDLKKWRRKLKYSQFKAAEQLGVSRGAVQHWECERNPIPKAIDLACEEIARRWKQRPDFGPVVLMCSDEPMWPESGSLSRVLSVKRELHSNIRTAIERANYLRKSASIMTLFVVGEDGGIIFANQELITACEKQQQSGSG